MRLLIGHKLFLAFVLTTAAVVAVLVLVQRYSFQRGFLDYVNGIELTRLEAVSEDLAGLYTEHGGWGFVAGEPRWPRQLFARSRGLDRTPPGVVAGSRAHRPPPGRPPDRHEPEQAEGPTPIWARLGLYGPQDEWLAGAQVVHRRATRQDIHAGDRLAGYLLLAPLEHLNDALDVQFAQQQRRGMYLAAVATFVAAALAALLLARSLVAPIRELARGTQSLAGGDFDTRIDARRRDELGQLAGHFNALAQALVSNRQARRQWVVDISHELRTPIAILKGEIEALEDGLRPLDRKALRSLAAEVQRLNLLVDDLYELSRSDAGALSYVRRAVDLATILDETLHSFRERFDARGLSVERAGTDSVQVFADPDRLRQLLANLLENALRYTAAGGLVRLSHALHGGGVRVTVEDSAPGVPEEALPRLFDRLFRVDPSRSRETGAAGLGLAICANIVQAHEGTIRARHSALGGLAIDVDLPLHTGIRNP